MPEDFEFYTTYEASHYCKPNPKYYLEILQKLDVKPEECLMVGNDVNEDMIAGEIGMDVFLLTEVSFSAFRLFKSMDTTAVIWDFLLLASM